MSPTNPMAKAMQSMGMSGPRTIVSVYPVAQSLELRHEGTKTYTLDAAPEGGFTAITVDDTWSAVKDWGTGSLRMAPVPGSVVADNLLRAWSQGRVGTGIDNMRGPGILICAGLQPTADEIHQAREKQTEYFRYLVHDADMKFAQDEAKLISDDHRMAAHWMGIKDRKWSQPMVPKSLVNCPACREEIYSDAVMCKHCRTNIHEFNMQRTKVVATEEPAKAVSPKVTRG